MRAICHMLFICTLLMLLSACEGNRKTEGSFTVEELSWLVYDDGDHFLFQNPDTVGDEITLFVTGFKDPAQLRNYYPIEAEVTLGNPQKGEVFKIYLLKDEMEFKRYLKVGDIYQSFDLVEPLKTFSVGDQNYKDVYVFKSDSASDNGVVEVYYARNAGIIQYTTRNGDAYQLLNNEQTP